jgi:hypothetical protein
MKRSSEPSWRSISVRKPVVVGQEVRQTGALLHRQTAKHSHAD